MPDKHHDAQPLLPDEAEKLYSAIRFIEDRVADKKAIADEIKERKELVTSQLPVNRDVLDFVLKRRANSKGTLQNFDTMLEYVEEAVTKIERNAATEAREKIAAAGRSQDRVPADIAEDAPTAH